MRPSRWINFNESDWAAFRASVAFLNGRLEERATIVWALKLKHEDTISRSAILELIDGPEGRKLSEPWKSAWRMIEESWQKPSVEDRSSSRLYDAQRRLKAGESSGSLITSIVEMVEPRLKVEPYSDLHWHYRKPRSRPKQVSDLFSASLQSDKIVNPDELGLTNVTDHGFIRSLCFALDAAVNNGLEIARRIDWHGGHSLWRLGQLHRVYYVPANDRDGEHEPDEFHRGIAPSVKLLHAAVSRLVEVNASTAISFVRRWKLIESPIHLRLWAALSRDPHVKPADEIGKSLLSLDDRSFWDTDSFPEIAELRARRFNEFNHKDQMALIARIRKFPPRKQWPRTVGADRIKKMRVYAAAQELRRIEIAGGNLPKRYKVWLDENIRKFDDLLQMSRVDEGFLESRKADWVPARPDSRYDMLLGKERLRALENALTIEPKGWHEGPSKGAADWINQPENSDKIIADFESIPDGGAAFNRVWERFGWVHSPKNEQNKHAAQYDLSTESLRVMSLLGKLPDETIQKSIRGISNWFSVWKKHITNSSEGINIWFKLWPIAVEDTNAEQSVDEDIHLNTVVESQNETEPKDLDTLNTPAGKLVGVFLSACPDLNEKNRPFDIDGPVRKMRDLIFEATGRSKLIAQYRMIEALPYFLKADHDWTYEHLIGPLKKDNAEALSLWRAIARRTHFVDVLKIIGNDAAERAIDGRLGRETRRSLVFSLIIECLYAQLNNREPAVHYARVQQMIRSLDDEVRAYGAEAVKRFIRDLSASRKGGESSDSAKQIFQSAAAPFLKQVWPQERSLATPGVSHALAELPAIAYEVFDEIVEVIERFLVPFDCWSMLEYGLFGHINEMPKLSIIDTIKKAEGFLKLLDLTIGTTEGSIIPEDLADALDQIRNVAPALAERREFRRLATLARRG